MRITATTLTDILFTLDVPEDLDLGNFKALCQVETGIPILQLIIIYNGQPLLDDKRTIKECGIQNNDCVVIQTMPSGGVGASGSADSRQQRYNRLLNTGGNSDGNGAGGNAALAANLDFSSIQIPLSSIQTPPQQPSSMAQQQQQQQTPTPSPSASSSFSSFLSNANNAPISIGEHDNPEFIRNLFLSRPDQLALLKQNNVPLADALMTGSLEAFTEVLKQQLAVRKENHEKRIRMLNADPLDHEAQLLIAEEIKQQNINSNMEAAMEYHPEAFGTVVMLYIDCRVNGLPVKAFVDSGAQTTIMSQTCAERCHVMRLVDTRFAGLAKGVGTQKIIGRIHMAQIQIGNDFLTNSFSVLEKQPMDMLIGLDMLKRHQCKIDLQRNVLTIGTTGTETPFLSESELPKDARLTIVDADERAADQAATLAELEEQEIADTLKKSRTDVENKGKKSKLMEIDLEMDQPSTSTAASSLRLQPSSQQTPQASSSTTTDNFTEEDINRIIKFGFQREQIITELRNSNGDVKLAMATLIAKSFIYNPQTPSSSSK